MANVPRKFESGVSTAQITFPATQVSSSDPNTLDDYEEIAWTPTVSVSGTTGNFAGSVSYAKATKIGDVVFFTAEISVTESSTATGNLRITVPTTPTRSFAGFGFESQNTGRALGVIISATHITISFYDAATVLGTASDRTYYVSGMYRQ